MTIARGVATTGRVPLSTNLAPVLGAFVLPPHLT